MNKLFFLLLLASSTVFSQSIPQDRVNNLKTSVVRVTVEGSDKMGTAFFVSKEGHLITNFHVISPSINLSGATITGFRKIYIQFVSGKRYEVKILPEIIKFYKTRMVAAYQDYCILVPVDSIDTKFTYLTLGSFADLLEGQEVLTCGYPLGLEKQFITRGNVSTILSDSILIYNEPSKRELAYLDLTMNAGNSGGPIIVLGKTCKEDRVFAIADFIIIPFSQQLDSLNKQLESNFGDIEINGLSVKGSNKLYVSALLTASNGLSGCVSIDYPNTVLIAQRKQLVKRK